MRLLRKILCRLWALYFYFLLFLVFLSFYPAFIFNLKFKPDYDRAHKLRRIASKIILIATGVIVKQIDKINIPKDTPLIFCANHSSLLDILICVASIDRYFHFLGKKELANIPLFGIFFRTIDIPVDRDSKIASYRAFKKASDDLSKGISLVIYPEGTTSTLAPKLLEFKSGAFKLAIGQNVPVLPMAILDNWHLLHYSKPWVGHPGISRIVFLPPYHSNLYEQEQDMEFAKKVKDDIEAVMLTHNPISHNH